MPTCFRNMFYSQDLLDPWPWQKSASDAWGGGFVRQNIFHKFLAPSFGSAGHVGVRQHRTLSPFPRDRERGTEHRGSLASTLAQNPRLLPCAMGFTKYWALLQRKPTHADTKAALCTLFLSALDPGMTQILCWSNLPLISASFLLANTPLHSLQDLCVFLSSVSKSKARSFKRDSSTQLVVKSLVMLLSCNFIKD